MNYLIKSITIKNFFSFHSEQTVELKEGINLLLGINGSGKTSFINALRLLSDGVAGGGMTSLIQEQWGGFDQIINHNGDETSDFARIVFKFNHIALNEIHAAMHFAADVCYSIEIKKSGTSYSLSEKIWARDSRGNGDFTFLDFCNGNGKISTRNDRGISLQEMSSDDLSGQESVLRQINDPVHYLPVYVLRKALESIAVYGCFNVAEGSKLRMPAEYSAEKRLRRSGENLANLLNFIKLNNSFDFDRLEERLVNVNPNYRSIDIANLYGQSYLMLREKNMRSAVGAMHISDGTLRFLLMESIFYNPSRGAIVALDEPERGMHPDMICSVAEMMKSASESSQLIAATHSPYLLNQFKLKDILIFEKNNVNISTVERLSEDDFPDWEGEYLPGQMWLMGQLGGKRW